MIKVCKKCFKELPLDCFSKGQGKFKKHNDCKNCDAARRRNEYHSLSKEARAEVKLKQRIRDYKRVYGLPDDLSEQLAKNREGDCVICKETKLLVVDHCHTTGKVRGLICSHCNSVLGYSKDSIEVLENAIKYLKDSINV